MRNYRLGGLFNAQSSLILNWLGQKGYPGELTDGLISYFQTKSGLTTGASLNDHIQATVTKLGYTGTLNDKLGSFFCTKMGISYAPDAERAFWNDTTQDFAASGIGGIDANTLMMLHMDGSNGGTTFTDSALSPTTMAANGNAQTSTTTPQFGTASALLDGTGDYVQGDVAVGLRTITGDFTIDCWVKFANSSGTTVVASLCDKNVGNHTIRIFYRYVDTRWRIILDENASQESQDFADNGITTGTWYHIAVVRTSGIMKFFRDGVQKGSNVSSSLTVTALANWLVGVHYDTTLGFNGNIDEFRVSNIARWTTTFTPPAAAYST